MNEKKRKLADDIAGEGTTTVAQSRTEHISDDQDKTTTRPPSAFNEALGSPRVNKDYDDDDDDNREPETPAPAILRKLSDIGEKQHL